MRTVLKSRRSFGPVLIAHQQLKYVAESEWGSRRYLDVTLLEG